MYMRACITWHTLSWWPLCSPHNITTGAVYTIMTCIARGSATSVAPFLHFCLSVFPSFSFCVSFTLCIPHTVHISLILSSFSLCHRLPLHILQQVLSLLWFTALLPEKNIAWLTLQGLNACVTWHLSSVINKHIIQCQQAWEGSCSVEGPSVQDEGQGSGEWVKCHTEWRLPHQQQLSSLPTQDGGGGKKGWVQNATMCWPGILSYTPHHHHPLAVYGELWPLTQTVRRSIDHMWHFWHCMHPRYASPWCQLISQTFSQTGHAAHIKSHDQQPLVFQQERCLTRILAHFHTR